MIDADRLEIAKRVRGFVNKKCRDERDEGWNSACLGIAEWLESSKEWENSDKPPRDTGFMRTG